MSLQSPHHLTASLNSPPASGLMSPAQAVQSPISFGVPSPLASLGRAVNPLTYASPSETSGATSPGRTFSVRTSPGRASPASSHCGSDIYGDSISAAEDNKTGELSWWSYIVSKNGNSLYLHANW